MNSKYQIVWAEFRAINGIVTKKDERLLKSFGLISRGKNGTRVFEHFASIEKAKEHVGKIDPRNLTKSYEVRFFTDAQFAKASVSGGEIMIRFTKIQENGVIMLQK